MRKTAGLILAVTMTVALSGCLEVHRPVVPDDLLSTADHDWVVTAEAAVGDSDFAPKAIETQYRYAPEGNDPGYPGVLVLVGLRTLQRLDEDRLVEVAREMLQDELVAQGVEADTVTEETGTRTIETGATTSWVTMTGTATSGSFLFSQAREIRVLAEAWFDDESNMHVVAVAIAQTVQTDLFGGRTDHGVWNELVGDADGSIEDAIHTEGFIDHVRTED